MQRPIAFVTACLLLGGNGCTSLLPPANANGVEADLGFDAVTYAEDVPTAETTGGPGSSPSAGPTPAQPPQDAAPGPSFETDSGPWIPSGAPESTPDTAPASTLDDNQRARTATFWTGIGALAVGGAGLLGFGITGRITQRQLSAAYDDGATRDRVETLQGRGTLMNGLTIGSAALVLVGLSLSSIAYALDFTHCGRLSQRRRTECPRGR